MNAPGKNILQITGILMLIYGLFSGFVSFISIYAMRISSPNDHYLLSLVFGMPWRTVIILACILCSASIGFGITVLVFRKRTDRAFIPLIQGGVLFVLNISFVIIVQGGLRFSYLDFAVSVVCILCIVGAVKNNAIANVVSMWRWICKKIAENKTDI
jgi:hypothetical protein